MQNTTSINYFDLVFSVVEKSKINKTPCFILENTKIHPETNKVSVKKI